MRFLFKIFYIGEKYSGYQRQPNGRGIENFIEIAFIKSKYIKNFKKNSYISVSRTDTGVNALGNIFSLTTTQFPDLVRLNSNLPKDGSIIIWGFSQIKDTFFVRKPSNRTYKYFLPYPSEIVYRSINRIFQFVGIHNFDNLIIKDGAGEINPQIEIYNITLEEQEIFIEITITGERFGRGQIRKMIGFLLDKNFLKLNVDDILHYPRIRIRPANPNFLLLNEINYNQEIKWCVLKNNTNRISQIKKNTSYNIEVSHIQNKLYETLISKYLNLT